MKIIKLRSLLLIALSTNIFISCSSSEADNDLDDGTTNIELSNEEDDVNNIDTPDAGDDTPDVSPPVDETPEAGIDQATLTALSQRFVFDNNIVIENSYNTECDSTPCRTIDEDLFDIFDNEDRLPDDNYFAFSDDYSVLNLECQLNKGRRIEFKQDSEGPLTTFSQLEMEGVFFDIPEDEPTGDGGGVTIAQVHNRGASSGNKPFFRVVLHENSLETVVRQLPVVSSSFSEFNRENFDFLNGDDYDGSPLRILLGKENNSVFIIIYQDGQEIVNRTYAPEEGTDWIDDEGISNGFYLKGGMYNDDVDHTENLKASYTRVIFTSDDTDSI